MSTGGEEEEENEDEENNEKVPFLEPEFGIGARDRRAGIFNAECICGVWRRRFSVVLGDQAVEVVFFVGRSR